MSRYDFVRCPVRRRSRGSTKRNSSFGPDFDGRQIQGAEYSRRSMGLRRLLETGVHPGARARSRTGAGFGIVNGFQRLTASGEGSVTSRTVPLALGFLRVVAGDVAPPPFPVADGGLLDLEVVGDPLATVANRSRSTSKSNLLPANMDASAPGRPSRRHSCSSPGLGAGRSGIGTHLGRDSRSRTGGNSEQLLGPRRSIDIGGSPDVPSGPVLRVRPAVEDPVASTDGCGEVKGHPVDRGGRCKEARPQADFGGDRGDHWRAEAKGFDGPHAARAKRRLYCRPRTKGIEDMAVERSMDRQ